MHRSFDIAPISVSQGVTHVLQRVHSAQIFDWMLFWFSNIENEKERTRVKTKSKPSFIHWAFDVQLFKWHETEIAFKEMLRKQDTWLPGVEAAHYTIFIHLSIQLLFFSWEAEYHETWAFPCCSLHFLPFSCFVPRIPHTHALFSISLHNSFNPKRCNLICYLFETVIFSFETAEY